MLGTGGIAVIKGNVLGVYYDPGAPAAIFGHVTDPGAHVDTNLSSVYVSNTLTSGDVTVGTRVYDLLLRNYSALPNLQPLMVKGRLS